MHEDVKENARKMLGHVLVTKQTGAAGKVVKRLYIEEGCDIARELYLGIIRWKLDTRGITTLLKRVGGRSIRNGTPQSQR